MNIDEQKKLVEEITTGKRKYLNMTDKFKFECTSCGKCCFDNEVVVNLYDLIRLRHALKETTQEILKKEYLNFYLGPSSGLPILAINFKKLNNEGTVTRCPFLVPALNLSDVPLKLKEIAGGDKDKLKELIEKYKTNSNELSELLKKVKVEKWLCRVHNDRPIICKLYPCGRLQEIDKDTKEVRENFILQDDEGTKDFCPGFRAKKETDLADFLATQDFWHSKEGSDMFTLILRQLMSSGFFVETPDNKNGKEKPMFKKNSKIMMFLGNLLYNFDSFNTFSQDSRVKKTIYSDDVTQDDFLYVENKVFDAVKKFTNMFKDRNTAELDFQQFMNSLAKEGEIN